MTTIARIATRISLEKDCFDLAGKLRGDDRREIMASGGLLPFQALKMGYDASSACESVMVDERVVGMCGIVPLTQDSPIRMGVVWMLGSDELTKYPVAFHRLARTWLEDNMGRYDALFNWVDCRATGTITWLKRLGFHFTTIDPEYGFEKRPFMGFIRGAYTDEEITNV